MYEKLPVDVRERNQTRIPSPGHKVTYHEHFGLLGETIQRPPENMKEWLTRNYGKNSTFIDTLQKTPEKIVEQVTYEVQPVEFHLIPEPVVHHEIVFHQPMYDEVVIHEEFELIKPQTTESPLPKKSEEKIPSNDKPEEDINMSFGDNNNQNNSPKAEEKILRKPYTPNQYGKYGIEPIVNSRRIHSPNGSRDPSRSEPKPYDPNLKAPTIDGDRDAFADKLRNKLSSIQSKVPPKKDEEQSRRGHKRMGGFNENTSSNEQQKKPLSPDGGLKKPTDPSSGTNNGRNNSKPSQAQGDSKLEEVPTPANKIQPSPDAKKDKNDRFSAQMIAAPIKPASQEIGDQAQDSDKLKKLKDQLEEVNNRSRSKPKSSKRKEVKKNEGDRNSPSGFEKGKKHLGYDPWAQRTRSKEKVDWDKHNLSPKHSPRTKLIKSPSPERNYDWDNSLNKGHLLGPSPAPLHLLPESYERKREVNPKFYKEGASYKVPDWERKDYDVESPVRAYIYSRSPARKTPNSREPEHDKKNRGSLSPANKYYLGLSQRFDPDQNQAAPEYQPEKTKFVMTEALKTALASRSKKTPANTQKTDNDGLNMIPFETREQIIFSQPDSRPQEADGTALKRDPVDLEEELRILFLDAMKSKLSIVEGYEEDVNELTRRQIEQIVWNEKAEGKILEIDDKSEMKKFQFQTNPMPLDMLEKRKLASAQKVSGQKTSQKNSSAKKELLDKIGSTVSSFDPSEKEILKKKMIDRMLKSREPPRQAKRLTKIEHISATERSRTPNQRQKGTKNQ